MGRKNGSRLCGLPVWGGVKAANLDARLAKVDQQTGLEAASAQIIEHLRQMFGSQLRDRFQLDKDPIFDKHVRNEFAYNHAIINYLDGVLLSHLQAIFSHPMGKCIFIYFFDKTNPQRIAHIKRAGNDLFCELIQRDGSHLFLVHQTKNVHLRSPKICSSPFTQNMVTIQPSTRNRGVTANERFLRVKQSPKAWFFLFNTRLLRAKNALAMTA
jgi:hypothetical protein